MAIVQHRDQLLKQLTMNFDSLDTNAKLNHEKRDEALDLYNFQSNLNQNYPSVRPVFDSNV